MRINNILIWKKKHFVLGFGLWVENVRLFAKISLDMYQWKPVDLSKLHVFVSRNFFEELCHLWGQFLFVSLFWLWDDTQRILVKKTSSGLLKLYCTCGGEIFEKYRFLSWEIFFHRYTARLFFSFGAKKMASSLELYTTGPGDQFDGKWFYRKDDNSWSNGNSAKNYDPVTNKHQQVNKTAY